MEIKYEKSINLELGQELYGIIGTSIFTYNGVYPITVIDIDYTHEEVIFGIDQPCQCVAGSFGELKDCVFETEEEAKNAQQNLEFGMGLYAYEY